MWDSAPYLTMFVGQNILQGSFHSNFDGEATIVKSAGGTLKYKGVT